MLRVGVVDGAGLGCPPRVDEEKDEERSKGETPVENDCMVEIELTLLRVIDRAGLWPSLFGVFVRLKESEGARDAKELSRDFSDRDRDICVLEVLPLGAINGGKVLSRVCWGVIMVKRGAWCSSYRLCVRWRVWIRLRTMRVGMKKDAGSLFERTRFIGCGWRHLSIRERGLSGGFVSYRRRPRFPYYSACAMWVALGPHLENKVRHVNNKTEASQRLRIEQSGPLRDRRAHEWS